MQKRIKEIRKALNLTQQEFADRLNVKRGAIANYEVGKNNPSNTTISLICRVFDVDEVWLRTGQGEMFRQRTRADDIAAYLGRAFGGKITPLEETFISLLARLTPEQWELANKKILEEYSKIMEEKKQEDKE